MCTVTSCIFEAPKSIVMKYIILVWVHGRCENQIHKCDKNCVKISKKHILFVSFNFSYMLLILHFELFISIRGYSVDTLFVYATLEWMFMSVDNTVFVWNVCPESSETDGMRMNAVYLHSGAKGVLWNSFLLHQYTASSISWGLWSRPAKHLLECCRAVLSRPSRQCSGGLSVLV